jgi:uncharacterized protein YegL
MEPHQITGTGYGFSATRISDLGSSEYTLVGITTDVSGSVSFFRAEEEKCLAEIVKACRRSPRADNLMLRLTVFDQKLDEIHGFKPLPDCNPDDYKSILRSGGMTALYDAALNAVESVSQYGKDLTANDFSANGIVFVITDGCNNAGKMTTAAVKKAVEKAVSGESLESVITILVGVNITDPTVSQALQDFRTAVGFTQYVEIGNATEKSLAKLAAFVSRSISSQSQALGSGGPSQSLTF